MTFKMFSWSLSSLQIIFSLYNRLTDIFSVRIEERSDALKTHHKYCWFRILRNRSSPIFDRFKIYNEINENKKSHSSYHLHNKIESIHLKNIFVLPTSPKCIRTLIISIYCAFLSDDFTPSKVL